MTTIKTPYDAEIERFEALVTGANKHGTLGHIWNNEHRLVLAQREGYLKARAEAQPLVEAVRRVVDVGDWGGALANLVAALAAYEKATK